MDVLRLALTGLWSSGVGLVRWSLSSVEDEPPTNVVPMPGPAHGPVPAIELRADGQRRKAS